MEYGSIERELYIEATPEVVFDVLTRPEHISQWWSAEADRGPALGQANRFTWTDEKTGRTESVPFLVVEIDRPRTFSFRWAYDDVVGPDRGLLVTFELEPAGAGTTVRFSETGFRERGWEAAVLEAQYNDHRQGWDCYLPRLADQARRLGAHR